MKKVVLLGAGFSYDLGMPLAYELTDVFINVFSEKNAKELVELVYQQNSNENSRPINRAALNEAMQMVLDYKGSNYEELLANIESLSDIYSNKTQSDRDSYHCLFSVLYSIIHLILFYYQVVSFSLMYPKNKEYFCKIENLLNNDETWVFTLNHDIYFECLALDFNIPITYGDDKNITFPKSNIEMDKIIELTYQERSKLLEYNSYFKDERGVNLVKLHGGLSELEYDDGQKVCNQSLSVSDSNELMIDFMNIHEMGYYVDNCKVPSGKDRVITDVNGELDIICQSMLTGGNKYSRTTNDKEGEEKLKLFSEQICLADEVTVIGYGFGDKHINNRLSNAMVKNENLKIQIVDAIFKPIPESLEQFDYDRRINRATCSAAHWMDYLENEEWNKEQMEHLKNNVTIRKQVLDGVKRLFPISKM
ncbi:hypothetical protein ERW49_07415 [Aliivibrio finisterrensis]|uniref:SIR2-like domain-containing protein n=1 Tax=Aliivibrio finisterrensis TaxID=511998 RepID=A0A4Q5KKS0_9GAMM|nr:MULTISPECIES: hypothetical protein [Aliivibrio]MDD9173646.1 hypothetical protein [Aliivibrio sp. S3TY1]MDD9190722.1 hypothetical protein [Aliivibrio sp. S2TY2]RYU46954.1 hypothetical protein ERW49_07415 [Aliivibrio finisterrensis]